METHTPPHAHLHDQEGNGRHERDHSTNLQIQRSICWSIWHTQATTQIHKPQMRKLITQGGEQCLHRTATSHQPSHRRRGRNSSNTYNILGPIADVKHTTASVNMQSNDPDVVLLE